MKKFLFFLVTLCLTNTSQAQFVKNDWGAIIGNPVNDTANGLSELTINGMEADASGNTIVIGSFIGIVDFDPSATILNISSPEPSQGGFLSAGFFAKYNSSGALVWAKVLGNAPGNLYLSALALDADGSVYLAGNYSGSGGVFDLNPNAGVVNTDPNSTNFRAKYDSNGNFIWGNGFNDLFNYKTTQLIINANDELVALEASSNPTNIASLIFLNKTDGALISESNLAGNGNIWDHISGTNNFQAKQDASGNYLVCGSLTGTMDVDPSSGTTNLISNGVFDSNAELFVCKYNSAMNLQWAFVLNADVDVSLTLGGAFPSGITTDESGNVFIAGVYKDTLDFDPGAGQANLLPSPYERGFIAKYSPSGNLVWARPIDENSASPVNQRSTISDLKLNPFDNTLYVLGGFDDYPKDLLINQGTLIIPAFSAPVNSNINFYSFITNLDLNGNTLNVNTVVPGNGDVSSVLSIENNGLIHICSSSFIQSNFVYNDLSFGACENNPIPYSNTDSGSLGFAISRYSPCTNPPQISTQPQDTIGCLGFPLSLYVGITGTACTKYFWMKINTNDNTVIPGFWEVVQDSSTLYFPSFSAADAGTYICTIEGECGSISTNVFTLTEQVCLGISEPTLDGFTIYPNPSSGILHISNVPQGSRIKLINTLGQVLLNMESADGNTSFDVSRFANGLYTIILEADGSIVTRKMVIQK